MSYAAIAGVAVFVAAAGWFVWRRLIPFLIVLAIGDVFSGRHR